MGMSTEHWELGILVPQVCVLRYHMYVQVVQVCGGTLIANYFMY